MSYPNEGAMRHQPPSEPKKQSAGSRFWQWLTAAQPQPIAGAPAINGIPPLGPSGLSLPETEVISVPSREREEGMGGVVASARRLTSADAAGRNDSTKGGAGKTSSWQEEAWELLDLIGEQRFLAHTLAGRMSQAALYVGKISPEDSPGTRPEKADDAGLQDLLSSIGDGLSGQTQLIHRAGVNLFVAGEVWLVGIPPRFVPGTPEHERAEALGKGKVIEIVDRSRSPEPLEDPDDPDDVMSLIWRMLSVTELNLDHGGKAKIKLEDGSTVEADPDDLYLIRIWRPHPRRSWEADSPTRASLPVLRELLGLTQHISAQVDSRLAGAGLLVISTEADAALKRAAGLDENDPRSPFMEALSIAMQTPIKDRSSASAIVPLSITVPGDVVDKIKHITFSTPLDQEARKLRDEAIRRLALGQDAPPELLLGTGGMNHWGAWLVREDVVNTHLEPPLSLICDALTTQYLRPLMLEVGFTEEQVNDYVVWYDVDHLIARPNRTQDAKDGHAVGVLSDQALREALGFEENDAPETTMDPVSEYVLALITKHPSLADVPGIPTLMREVGALLNGGTPEERPAPAATSEDSSGSIPDTDGDAPPVGTPGNPGGALQ